MQTREEAQRMEAQAQRRPRVIAVLATRTQVDPALFWSAGLAMVACSWLTLLLH